MFGITTVLAESDYRSYYIAGNRPREIQLDSSYGLCFGFTVLRVIDLIRANSGDRIDIDLHFVLESGHKNFGDAERIFYLFKKRNTPDTVILQTLTSGDKKDFPGLQAADAGACYTPNSELKRGKPPGTIRIFAPESDKPTRQQESWLHLISYFLVRRRRQ